MARQLAALPKKQFEMYRSKKILSTEHSVLSPGSNKVIKDRLSCDFIDKSFISNVEKDLIILQDQVEVLDSLRQASCDAKPKAENKKKRVKSKKRKSTDSAIDDPALLDSASNAGQETGINFVKDGKGLHFNAEIIRNKGIQENHEENINHNKFDSEECSPVCVSMDSNLVADISITRGLDARETCGSSSSNDSGIVTPKELFFSDDSKEVDWELGSYTSPAFAKEPPFGFPPSSQRLLESALDLLPSAIANDKKPQTSKNFKKFSKKSGCFGGSQRLQDSERGKTAPKRKGSSSSSGIVQDDPISDFVDTKENCKDCVVVEGDSIDGDISSSSAIEDNGGWQSQTRSHRRKKKEHVARFNRERNNTDHNKFQRKDFDKPQSQNQFRKSNNYRRQSENKKNQIKPPEKVSENTDNKINNVNIESSVVSTNMEEHFKDSNKKDNSLNYPRELNVLTNDKLGSFKKVAPTPKKMSYRDALLKTKAKEPAESSDGGVHASNKGCFCLSNSQDSFNNQQCVEYLRNAWQQVMLDAKKGLVTYLNVDSDPALREKKT